MAAITDLAGPAPEPDAAGRRVLSIVTRYALKWRSLAAVRGALEGLGALALVLAMVIAIGGRGPLSAHAQWGWIVAALFVLTPALVRFVWPLSISDAAMSLEHAFPFLQDRVATAVDLARHGTRAAASERIVARVMSEAARALDALPLDRALPLDTIRRPVIASVVGALLLAGAWVARPPSADDRGLVAPITEPPVIASERDTPGPHLYDLVVSIIPPAYAGLPPRTLAPRDRTISALYGSRVTVAASAEPERATARLHVSPGAASTMGSIGPGRRSASFTLTERVTCRVECLDGGRSTRTTEWVIEPIADSPPTVRLAQPARDLTLDGPGPVEVVVSAGDDFLVTAVGLRCRLDGERHWRSLPLTMRPGASVTASSRLNPTSLGLVEGKALLLRAWATDNDTVSGPKTSVSPTVTIRLRSAGPAPEPVTRTEQAEQQQADAFADLQQAAQEFERELGDALDQLSQGVDSDEMAQMSTRLQEAAQRLQEQAGQVEAAMGQLEAQLAMDELVTPELREKVRELHQLMQEALSEELRQALEELQRALQEADPNRMQMSLEQARKAQQQFMARLDQTLELLKRARLEMELTRLRKLAEELLARQSELGEKTDALADDRSPEGRRAEQEQRRLARDTEPLANEVAVAAESARDVSAELSRELDALAGELMRRDAPGDMREAAGALGRGKPSAARDPQQRAMEALQLAASRLAEAEQSVSQEMRAELTRAIQEMLRDTLRLSQGQEDMAEATRRVQAGGAQDLLRDKRLIGPLRRQQEALSQSVERLAGRMDELARRTPVMDAGLGRDVSAVAHDMRQAAREIEGAQLSLARSRQQEAVARLNDAAQRLLELGEAAGGASAGEMLSDYIQRLQGLAERQRGLNDQAGEAADQGRQPGQGPGSSLAQMAFEQAMIRSALEQMIRGAQGANKQVADQLGGVAGEMEKVEGDLRGGRLNRETLERQGQILQKMLNAQRSLYTRDPERRERQAERPKAWEPPPPPPPLSPSLMQRRSLRLSPQPAQPRLPEGFEDMVQAYFERLGEGR